MAQTLLPSAITNDILDGIWENDSHIVSFSETNKGDLQTDIVLKTFYGFYYDGIYTPHESLAEIIFARIDDGLYMQYWISSPVHITVIENRNIEIIPAPGIFWRPAGNRSEFTIDTVPIQTEVTGYYIDEQHIYKVRYWLTPAEFTDEKAELTLKTNKNTALSQDDFDGLNDLETVPQIVYIDKYIQIGEDVYTCVTGLRTIIRNVTTIETLPGTPTITEGLALMVLDAPYLVLSDIANLEVAIEEHNSIIYPPRNGRPRFVEPSIYKKLRSMTIEDYTVEAGENF